MSSTLPSAAPTVKRRRESIGTGSNNGKDEYCFQGNDSERPKKLKSDEDKASDQVEPAASTYVVLHNVVCSGSSTAHTDHPDSTWFLDTPSLDRGDNKATPLRGKHKIRNWQSYLHDFPRISFVVRRFYNCEEFHTKLEKSEKFRKIDIGQNDVQVARQLRPYLFVLATDADQAEPTQEKMSLTASGALKRALEFCFSRESIELDNLAPPYLQFYRARRLVKNVERHLTPQWKIEIRALYAYLDEQFGDEYNEADEIFSRGYFTRRHLKLFGPGDVLVKTKKSEPVGMLAKRILQSQESEITIECETWSFDGAFKKIADRVRISVPSECSAQDLIPITSLDISPLHFNPSSLKDTLQKRGEIFWRFRKPGLVSYSSPTKGFEIQVPNPRCMIDMETYNELHGEADGSEDGEEDPHTFNEQNDPPAEPFLVLLPPTIKAFRFHDKKWKTLAVKYLRHVKWNKQASERLVLKQDKKDLIEALVTNHLEAGKMADVIEGKGNGLVVLLHGGPGTGKTFTAEGVAEIAERPLYRLTCGDIGTDPETVEKSLEHIFYLGTIWKAVVVLDEAEVFLEERTQADLQRNALVSVFLRALEYYDGILILTTNRGKNISEISIADSMILERLKVVVGTFDEAFKSRIHLALHYPPLSNDDRWRIWSNFIQALKDEHATEDEIEINHEDLRRKVDALARHKLNGRQIRNSVRTAKQLAKFKHEVMSSTHVERTIEVIKEFEKYIEDTHGHTDADWVESGRIRIDKAQD